LAALAGVRTEELRPMMLALGYRAVIEDGAEFFVARPRRHAAGQSAARKPHEGHPFAKLKELKFA